MGISKKSWGSLYRILPPAQDGPLHRYAGIVPTEIDGQGICWKWRMLNFGEEISVLRV